MIGICYIIGMTHTMKVIIGFTVMIAIGIGILYYNDQKATADTQNQTNSTNNNR